MISCKIHGPFVDSYLHDFTTVWENITAIFQETSACTYYKYGKTNRNSSKVYVSIFEQYIFPKNVDNIVSAP